MAALRDVNTPRPVRGNGKHPAATAAAAARKPNPFKVHPDLLARVGPSRRRTVAPEAPPQLVNPFAMHALTLPPGVGPKDHKPKLAMDEAGLDINTWAINTVAGLAYSEGLAFPGYPVLAQMTQRAEYRQIVETIATEMTRKWVRLQSKTTAERKAAAEKDGEGEDIDDRNGTDDGQTRRIGELGEFLDKLKVRDAFRAIAEQDGFFGRAHLYPDIGDADNADEQRVPIGNGLDALSKAKVNQRKPLLGVRPLEAMWCYPLNYNSTNPLRADWYKPQQWYAMSQPIHVSRLLTFVGREVPDILKPAYSFGGLALTQMAKPYVDNWLRTRQSVADLIHAFSVFVLSTDLGVLLQAAGEDLLTRADLFNRFRDNRGLMLVDNNREKLENVSAPLGTLDVLLAMSQEQIASVARIPLVKLLGISPKGLNASSEGEIRVFYDSINAYQERFFTDHLRSIIGFAQLTLWGKIDEDITFAYEPLWSLDEKALAEKRKIEAETDMVYVDGGVLDPAEVRERIAADPDTPYAGIDPEDVPEPPEMPMMGGPGGEGDDPGEPGPGEPPARKPNGDGRAAAQDAVLPFVDASFAGDDGAFAGLAADAAEWNETDHPRGQPGNAGQFGSGGGGSAEPSEGAKSPHEGKRGKFKSAGTGNLAKQGFKPRKRGDGNSPTQAMQVAWHVAQQTGRPQTVTVNNLGYVLLKKGETIPHGHPHISVDPDGNVTRYEADLGERETETPGESMATGTGISHETAQRVIDQVSADLDFPAERISVSSETKTFELNGKTYHYAGSADLRKPMPTSAGTVEGGEIKIYSNHVSEATAAGVVAHEVMHEKFQGALDAYRREADAVMQEPGPDPNPEHQYWWGRQGGSAATMKPDGSLREPYDKKFPIYTAWHTAFGQYGTEAFQESDGVSDYSFEYWKAYANGTVSSHIAMHETLAEIARIKYETGKFPDHWGLTVNKETGLVNRASKAQTQRGAKLWRNLHRTIDQVWNK